MKSLFAVVAALSLSACSSSLERRAREALPTPPSPRATARLAPEREEPSRPFDGTLAGYQEHAQRRSPLLRQRYEEWSAGLARIDAQGGIPAPTIRYTVFLSPVETRVGPQRHKLGVTQAFPWPTVLSNGAESASFAALSLARQYDAEALLLQERVARAYWSLWLLEQHRETMQQQQKLLSGISEAARARIEIGNAGLSHLSQVHLAISRLQNQIDGIPNDKALVEATLRELLIVTVSTKLPIRPKSKPRPLRLVEEASAVTAHLAAHPQLEAVALMAESRGAAADRAAAKGLPGFSIGADWIEVGPATAGSPADSGKDAVSLTAMISIPIWRGAYDGNRDAARAERRALLAKRDAMAAKVEAALRRSLTQLDETIRQTKTFEKTLLPQAETAIEATLGEYQIGHTGLAQVLLAQRDAFEIQRKLDRAIAENRMAWARVEATAGRALKSERVSR